MDECIVRFHEIIHHNYLIGSVGVVVVCGFGVYFYNKKKESLLFTRALQYRQKNLLLLETKLQQLDEEDDVS